MGASSSKNVTVSDQLSLLSAPFDRFVEQNCVFGPDKNIHIQKLESAFAFYLEEKEPNVARLGFWNPTTIAVVHRYLPALLRRGFYNKLTRDMNKIKISPGFTAVVSSNSFDTRFVVGIDVHRF